MQAIKHFISKEPLQPDINLFVDVMANFLPFVHKLKPLSELVPLVPELKDVLVRWRENRIPNSPFTTVTHRNNTNINIEQHLEILWTDDTLDEEAKTFANFYLPTGFLDKRITANFWNDITNVLILLYMSQQYKVRWIKFTLHLLHITYSVFLEQRDQFVRVI